MLGWGSTTQGTSSAKVLYLPRAGEAFEAVKLPFPGFSLQARLGLAGDISPGGDVCRV